MNKKRDYFGVKIAIIVAAWIIFTLMLYSSCTVQLVKGSNNNLKESEKHEQVSSSQKLDTLQIKK